MKRSQVETLRWVTLAVLIWAEGCSGRTLLATAEEMDCGSDAGCVECAVTTTQVSSGSARAQRPQAIGHEDGYVVAYWDPSSTPTARMVRVGPSGMPITAPVQVSPAGMAVGAPRLAWGDGQLNFLWADFQEETTVPVAIHFGARALDGSRVGVDAAVITAARPHTGSIAYDGASYGVAWATTEGAGGGLFARFASDGSALSAPTTATGFGDCLCSPVVVSDAFGWVVGFENDGLREAAYTPALQRFDAAGSPVGDPFEVTGDLFGHGTRIAVADAELGVAWRDLGTTLGLSRVRGSEVVAEHTFDVASRLPEGYLLLDHAIAWTGTHYALAYLAGGSASGGSDGAWEVHLMWLTTEGQARAHIQIGDQSRGEKLWRGADAQISLVWNGESLALFWPGTANGNPEIFMSRIDCPPG